MTNEELEAKVKELIEESGHPALLARAIENALAKTHRTIQQNFWSAVKLAIHHYAHRENATDGRNKESQTWAQEVAALKNGDLRFPYI